MKVKIYYYALTSSEIEVDDKFSAILNKPEWGNVEENRAHEDLVDEFTKVVSKQIDEVYDRDDIYGAYDMDGNLLVDCY